MPFYYRAFNVCRCLQVHEPRISLCVCVRVCLCIGAKAHTTKSVYRNNRSHYFDAMPPAAFEFATALYGMFDSMLVCICHCAVFAPFRLGYCLEFSKKKNSKKKRLKVQIVERVTGVPAASSRGANNAPMVFDHTKCVYKYAFASIVCEYEEGRNAAKQCQTLFFAE